MIPLAPPLGYWDWLQSLVSKFIWKGKRPRLKLTTLQRDKTIGGPDFKIYFWSYVLAEFNLPISSFFFSSPFGDLGEITTLATLVSSDTHQLS